MSLAAKFAFARHVNSPDENRQQNLVPQHILDQISLCRPRRTLYSCSALSVISKSFQRSLCSRPEQGYVRTYLNSDMHLHYISSLGLTLETSKELQGICVDPTTNSLFRQTQSNLAKGSSVSSCNCDAFKQIVFCLIGRFDTWQAANKRVRGRLEKKGTEIC